LEEKDPSLELRAQTEASITANQTTTTLLSGDDYNEEVVTRYVCFKTEDEDSLACSDPFNITFIGPDEFNRVEALNDEEEK
jgi:hypothetical protein